MRYYSVTITGATVCDWIQYQTELHGYDGKLEADGYRFTVAHRSNPKCVKAEAVRRAQKRFTVSVAEIGA